jgi:tripartite-type tricarboxylate transporter receptor subunit TctC
MTTTRMLRKFMAGARRALIAGCIGGLAASAAAQTAAPDYPAHPITMIVPFSPGGVADILGRVVANGLKDAIGQPGVVENKAGADGNIGAGYVAAAKPDGYTLLVGPVSTNAINPSLHKGLKFDARKDFVAIANLATVPNVLVVNPRIPAHTVSELIALLKKGDYSFASGGTGGSQHLSGEMFKALTHTRMLHIPYKGGNAQMADLLAGRVDLMFCNLPVCLPFIKSGELTALGVTTKARSALLPEVPTIAEAGVPGYAVEGWFGLFAPTGTPPGIVARLNAAVVHIMNDASTKTLLQGQGAAPGRENAEQFGAYVHGEQERWGKIIREQGISVP